MSSFWRGGRREEGRGKRDEESGETSLRLCAFARDSQRVLAKAQRRKGKAVLLFLLPLSLLPPPLAAGPYADLDARLKGRPEAEAVVALSRLSGKDEEARAALDGGPRAARAYIGLRATLEGAPSAPPPVVEASPTDERIASSWLGRAFDRLRMPSLERPRATSGSLAVGPWATFLMWGLLAALGLLAACLLVRYARLPGLRRKRRAVVGPDEPERTADAWIEEADDLVAQGRFREAIRGLYVAGLLRFDEAGVARFDRHQTNWEHLRRIEESARKPKATEIRDATLRFDRAWYGRQAAGREDADAMRAWYDALVRQLAEARAA